MNLTVDKLVVMQGRLFELRAVIEDIEATASTALRELDLAQPRPMNMRDRDMLSFALGISEQIEIYSRVFTEIEASVEQTLDISAIIETDIKEMAE